MARLRSSQIPHRVKQTSHACPHTISTTIEHGWLNPLAIYEMVPGEHIHLPLAHILKMDSLASPMYQDSNLDLAAFYVPMRQVWPDCTEFFPAGDAGIQEELNEASWPSFSLGDLIELFPPALDKNFNFVFDEVGRLTSSAWPSAISGPLPYVEGGIIDRMGIRPITRDDITDLRDVGIFNEDSEITTWLIRQAKLVKLSIPQFLTYQWCYNQFFRNEWFKESTSFPSVQHTFHNTDRPDFQQFYDKLAWDSLTPGSNVERQRLYISMLGLNRVQWEKDYFTTCLPRPQRGDAVPIPTGSGATIDAFNLAVLVQRWRRSLLSSGSRFREWLLGRYGTSPSDLVLQLPKLLATGHHLINVDEVLRVGDAGDTSTTAIGDRYGRGGNTAFSMNVNCTASEPAYLIVMAYVRPRTMYTDMIPRHFLRRDHFDFPDPEWANLPDQPVSNNEVCPPYASIQAHIGHPGVEVGTFGYNPRFSEMRYQPSYVSGDFRSIGADSWHQGRVFLQEWQESKFANPRLFTSLNPRFLECRPTMRIFNGVQAGEPYKLMFACNMVRRNPFPMFSNPIT